MKHEDLAMFGLTEKDIPRMTPEGIRKMIAWADSMLAVWSLPWQDRENYTRQREALQRMLAEIEPQG